MEQNVITKARRTVAADAPVGRLRRGITTTNPLNPIEQQAGATFTQRGGITIPAHFGNIASEYQTATLAVGLHDRRYRGLIEISGADRATWLNNLVTNVIKTLTPGDGNYTFCINAKGRILFDGNMIVQPEAIWFDVERSHVTAAMQHFDKYIITEDVALTDRSEDFTRLSLLGPNAVAPVTSVGASNVATMAQLQHRTVTWNGIALTMLRHDFAGVFGIELFVPADRDGDTWAVLLDAGKDYSIAPVGLDVVQALRIEAGIPWLGDDIDDDVLPAETQQIERGINYQKGCYLGQEVVERMRSRGSLAKKLVGLTIAGETIPSCPTPLKLDEREVGRLTSACHSPAIGAVIGLGYLKTANATEGTQVTIANDTARVTALPFRKR